jgi:hypothetical protein
MDLECVWRVQFLGVLSTCIHVCIKRIHGLVLIDVLHPVGMVICIRHSSVSSSAPFRSLTMGTQVTVFTDLWYGIQVK